MSAVAMALADGAAWSAGIAAACVVVLYSCL